MTRVWKAGSSIWPDNLNSIDIPDTMTTTELWMIKEQIESGALVQVEPSEKLTFAPGQWATLYANQSVVYSVITQGDPQEPAWCMVLKIFEVSPEQASALLSGYPYDYE